MKTYNTINPELYVLDLFFSSTKLQNLKKNNEEGIGVPSLRKCMKCQTQFLGKIRKIW